MKTSTIEYYLMTKAILIKNGLEVTNIILGVIILGLLAVKLCEPEDYEKVKKEYRALIVKSFFITTVLNIILPNTLTIKMIITEWSRK